MGTVLKNTDQWFGSRAVDKKLGKCGKLIAHQSSTAQSWVGDEPAEAGPRDG